MSWTRRLLPLAALVGSLLIVLPAEARTSLPSLLARQIQAINAAPHAPAVLLPPSLPIGTQRVYPTGGVSGSGYDLELGAVPHCGGDACFIASFSASKSGAVFGTPVTVRGASKAGYHPLSCGGSCAPPQIDFLVHGILYTIQANLETSHGDRATLINAAQAAISAGPR
jgi:hypothetical protein